VLVDADVNARDLAAVLRAIREHFDPSEDFLLLPGVPFDTLDFTSFTLNLGSKMVLDATRNGSSGEGRGGSAPGAIAQAAGSSGAARAGARPGEPSGGGRPGAAVTGVRAALTAPAVQALHPRIRGARLLEDTLLAVRVEGEGREVVQALVAAPHLSSVKLIAAVSEDVALDDRESLLWGIFTRFDPARDVVFTSAQLQGAWPVYRGRLGIDATFKLGYPDPIQMTDEIRRLVDRRWSTYWG
jgi:4-hydroxy-3-polyprenylbenzoate decarboxylase